MIFPLCYSFKILPHQLHTVDMIFWWFYVFIDHKFFTLIRTIPKIQNLFFIRKTSSIFDQTFLQTRFVGVQCFCDYGYLAIFYYFVFSTQNLNHGIDTAIINTIEYNFLSKKDINEKIRSLRPILGREKSQRGKITKKWQWSQWWEVYIKRKQFFALHFLIEFIAPKKVISNLVMEGLYTFRNNYIIFICHSTCPALETKYLANNSQQYLAL